MIKPYQLKNLVYRTLMELQDKTDSKVPYSGEARDLILMTVAHESVGGTYLWQDGGPALGIGQMEPKTEEDLWDNWIMYRNWLQQSLGELGYYRSNPAMLEYDLRYCIIMMRLHYFRTPDALPKRRKFKSNRDRPSYHEELARFAKQHYNTALGKATWQRYLGDYEMYMDSDKENV